MAIIERDFPVEELNKIALKEANAKKPIYQIHKWWARRLGCIFRAIILLTFLEEEHLKKFSQSQTILGDQKKSFKEIFWGKVDNNGKLIERGIFYRNVDLSKILGYTPIILDPFMGGGTTVVEALRLGCKVIGIDINPVAWFVTKKEVEPVDLEKLEEEFKKLEEKVGEKIKNYYKTICPKCKKLVDVMYVFWVKKVKCIACGKKVPLFTSFRIATKKSKKGSTHIIFCPKCREIFETTTDYRLRQKCPHCGYEFLPAKGYVERGKYTCPSCGQKAKVLDAVKREGKTPDMEMYAIEYYCPTCKKRGYKKADEHDYELYLKAKEEFERKKDKLLFPRQKIPDGYNTQQVKNFLYEYFYQMFNERQLLCLSMLLEEILKIKDESVKEAFLLIFSDITQYQNMFCKYDPGKLHSTGIFTLHAYWPPNSPLEGNIWGAKIGARSFVKYYRKFLRGKEFTFKPFEIHVRDGESVKYNTGEKITGQLAFSFEELLDVSEFNTLLRAQTSEDLSFIPDNSIDAVITDPPYYDNVEYSEVADFFYVWLRLGLKDKYKEFQPKLSPRTREIVVNKVSKKDERFFIQGLKNVWKECYRVLKDGGLLVFTFHHRETEAWASVLKSLLNANFYVIAVYPVFSEMRTSAHIMGKESRAFDTIIVARKRKETKETKTWEQLKDEIYLKAKEALKRVRESHTGLTNGDVSTIVLGKCLEVYSKYYPNVVDENGKPIDVDTAVKGIIEIIDVLNIEEYVPEDVDEVTSIYIRSLAKLRIIDFNELNKILQPRGLSEKLLKDAFILYPKGSIYRILSPKERGKIIEEKVKAKKFEHKYYIDVIHHLYYVYTEFGRLIAIPEKFDIKIIGDVLGYLHSKTKDETYKILKDLLKEYKPPKTTLEEFM